MIDNFFGFRRKSNQQLWAVLMGGKAGQYIRIFG